MARARRLRRRAAAFCLVSGRLPPPTLHPVEPYGKGWRCRDCMHFARQRLAAVFATPRSCAPAAWAPFLSADAQGHVLWAASVLGLEDVGALSWCSRCGAYISSGRACGLRAVCPSAPTSVGAGVRLRRLAASMHPLSSLQLGRPYRVLPPLSAAEPPVEEASASEPDEPRLGLGGGGAASSGDVGGAVVSRSTWLARPLCPVAA